MADIVRRQILFERTTQYGIYRDAIYYPEDVYQTLSQSDIEAAIQARVDGYVYTIQNPPTPPVYDPQYTVTNEDGTVTDA